jgi:hypothetical protein
LAEITPQRASLPQPQKVRKASKTTVVAEVARRQSQKGKPLNNQNRIFRGGGREWGLDQAAIYGGQQKRKESRGPNCTALRCNFNLPSTLHYNLSLIAGIATGSSWCMGGSGRRTGRDQRRQTESALWGVDPIVVVAG